MDRRLYCLLSASLLAAAAIGPAAAETHEVCVAYANDAVAAFEENQRRNCGWLDPRWHGNRDAHYNWCRSAPSEWVRNERTFRANNLRVCRREPGTDACREYAILSQSDSTTNSNNHCGFTGARWGGSYDHHLAWCLGVPIEAANREIAIRHAMIGVCTGNAEARRCDAYARKAEAQVREAGERNCLFTGARWTPLYEDHLTWCLGQPAAVAEQESREREGPLSQCRTQRPTGGAPEACTWTANVRTESCTNGDGSPSDASGTSNTGCGATQESATTRAKAGLSVLLTDEDTPPPGTCTYEVDVRAGCGCG